jgi:hypothetical protein
VGVLGPWDSLGRGSPWLFVPPAFGPDLGGEKTIELGKIQNAFSKDEALGSPEDAAPYALGSPEDAAPYSLRLQASCQYVFYDSVSSIRLGILSASRQDRIAFYQKIVPTDQ